MKWQRSRCLVVSRLSGDLFTFKFSELDDVTSEGACREGGPEAGRGCPSKWVTFVFEWLRCDGSDSRRKRFRLVSPRLAASSSSFFVAL